MSGWTAIRHTKLENTSMSTPRKVSRERTKVDTSRFGNVRKMVRGNYPWIWECRSNSQYIARGSSQWRVSIQNVECDSIHRRKKREFENGFLILFGGVS